MIARWFSDSEHGGRDASLARATEWRDRLLKRLPPATMIRTRYAPNQSGVIGVQFARDRTRAGRPAHRYRAMWFEVDGRQMSSSFSVAKYGARRAKALAIEARKRAVTRVLEERKRLLRQGTAR